MSVLRIYTLGTPRIAVEGREVHLPRKKSVALLCYLALQEESIPRSTLAHLLWETSARKASPPSKQDKALGNLRRALFDLVQTTGSQWFEISRASVRLKTEEVWVDAAEFERLSRPNSPLFPRDLERDDLPLEGWKKALGLYRGPFLEGLHIHSRGFDLWKSEEERLWEGRLIPLLHNLSHALFLRAEYEEALALATRWHQTDESDDRAHHLLMQIYLATGQRSRALQQYRTYLEMLREYSLSPTPPIQSLYEHIRGEAASAGPRLPASPPREQDTPKTSLAQEEIASLPVYFSPFVGRESEVGAIIARLQSPECRLLTIVAPGGIGKTRLAVKAGERLRDDSFDRVLFVDLSQFAPGTNLYEALQDKLLPSRFLQDTSEHDAIRNVTHMLDGKTTLLILDNFEHLTTQAINLPHLLTALPRLKILVTSRERLNLHGEWVYPLDGLSYPRTDEIPSGLMPLCKQYSAIQLFANRARQNAPSFQITDENREHVIRICRLVEGSPLAIEMSAAWVGQFSCQVIANELSTRLDILQSNTLDLPPRQRTYRASCDYSWTLLTPYHQEILCKLSIFSDNFTYEAARQIVGLQLKDLKSLVDKSWIRSTKPGQYHLHALLRQYLREKLEECPAVAEQTRQQHASYYARYLEETSRRFLGAEQTTALERCDQNRENIHAAWEWAVARPELPLLETMCAPLFTFYRLKNLFRVGRQRYERAMRRLEEIAPSSPLHNHVRNRYAWFAYILGEQHRAEALWKEGLRVSRQAGDTAEEAFCLYNLGLIAQASGQWEEAIDKTRLSLRKYRQLGDAHAVANCQKRLGYILSLQKEYPEAEKHYRRCLQIYESLGDQYNIALVNAFLSDCAYAQGHTAQARLLAQQALETANKTGNRRLRALALNRLASTLPPREAVKIHRSSAMIFEAVGDRVRAGIAYNNLAAELIEVGEYAEAENAYYLALQTFDDSHDKRGRFFTTFNLGRLHILWGNLEIAQRHLMDALLQAAHTLASTPLELYALSGFALFFQALGKEEEAVCLAATVIQHPQTEDDARLIAEETLTRVAGQVGEENMSRWIAPIPSKEYEALRETLLSSGICSPPARIPSETPHLHPAEKA